MKHVPLGRLEVRGVLFGLKNSSSALEQQDHHEARAVCLPIPGTLDATISRFREAVKSDGVVLLRNDVPALYRF